MTSYVPSYFPPALTSPFDPPSPPPMRKKLLTYSYRGKLAYVPCADSHQEALEIAREVYPSLAAHPPSALAFYVLFVDARACGLEGDVYGVQNLCGGGGECGNVRTLEAVGERVGIAPRVWASLVADLPAYNIVYVSVDGEEEEEEEEGEDVGVLRAAGGERGGGEGKGAGSRRGIWKSMWRRRRENVAGAAVVPWPPRGI